MEALAELTPRERANLRVQQRKTCVCGHMSNWHTYRLAGIEYPSKNGCEMCRRTGRTPRCRKFQSQLDT